MRPLGWNIGLDSTSRDRHVPPSGHSSRNPQVRVKKVTLFSAKRSSSLVAEQLGCDTGVRGGGLGQDPLWSDGFTLLCCAPAAPARAGRLHETWVLRPRLGKAGLGGKEQWAPRALGELITLTEVPASGP
uniref:Uncharacterized protein n=1 Tax=Molossus molossus TaxID=27622 RepID=A0A7J8FZ62_MOLMO|nr:hypothetical protein HJG59_008141 [Molossus molossus]